MAVDAENLVWIDLEMTGLDPDRDHIIEIATIVTDKHLNVLAEGPMLAIHQPDAVLDAETIVFLSEYVPAGASPMSGNSICQDRRFMVREMPKLEAFFHYRNLDVSALKELARRWAPEVYNGVTKQGRHLALDDIRDSIAELAHYREHFLKLPEPDLPGTGD